MTWQPKVLFTALGFEPHRGQLEILEQADRAVRRLPGAPRFLDAATGRQWGKTMTAETSMWMGVLAGEDGFGPPAVKLVADTYEHGNLVWDKFIGHAYGSPMLRPLMKSYIKDRELLTFTNGATAQKLSSDRPQGLVGFTLTMAVVDEAAFVSDDALELLLPCLAVRQGTLLAFGTAEGQGWHRTWFLRGQDAAFPEHWSATYASTDSPYFPPEELDIQRQLLPRRRFEQLYLARWQAEEGAVFHNVGNCTLADAPESVVATKGRRYIIGVDFGRHQDFTVAYVGDSRTGRVLHQERFNEVDWMAQIERIKVLAGAYPGTVVADATGIGDVVVSHLQAGGLDVVPVVMTPPMKERLVQRLVVALEREELRFPAAYDTLLRELTMFEARQLPSGRTTTGAPPGFHDDCVMALALLNEGIERGYGSVDRVAHEDLF